ncbi:hypothetical protein MAR_020050, partial [Mya arenaria]
GQQYVPSEKCGWNKYHCSLAVPEVEFNEHGKMNAHVSPAVNEDLAYIVKSLGDCRLATGCQTVGIQKHTQDIKVCLHKRRLV